MGEEETTATSAGAGGPRRAVTVVCTANVCRSPMAAALLRHAFAAEESPVRDLVVHSAGISAMGGDGASAHSVKALEKVGLKLGEHRSQMITAGMVKESLVLFVMTDSHRYILEELFPDNAPPIKLFRELMPEGSELQIPDPYGMDLAAYEASRDSMVEALPSIVAYVKKLLAEEDSASR